MNEPLYNPNSYNISKNNNNPHYPQNYNNNNNNTNQFYEPPVHVFILFLI